MLVCSGLMIVNKGLPRCLARDPLQIVRLLDDFRWRSTHVTCATLSQLPNLTQSECRLTGAVRTCLRNYTANMSSW
jgi:hypothetical protein